jgi:hypothetical protein
MDVNSKQQTITQQDNMVLEPVVLYITVNTMLFVAHSMMVLMSGHSIHISMCLTASGCLWLILIHTKIMKNMLNVLGAHSLHTVRNNALIILNDMTIPVDTRINSVEECILSQLKQLELV